jgi:hypothetical protein
MEGPSLSARARAQRFRLLLERFPALREMRVLDLGGEPHTWRGVPVRPREVVLLNLEWKVEQQQSEAALNGSWLRAVAGDACDPPEGLGGPFDLVFSNSVIEHVGGHGQRCAFARTARSLGEHYWVQTPNRLFPIEPHWVFPAFQFLPKTVAARIMLHWPLGNFAGRAWSYEQALDQVEAVELLRARDLRSYFPDAVILRERWMGLTKSLIATG